MIPLHTHLNESKMIATIEALRESQANLQSFLDTASDLIQILDQFGHIQYVNTAWYQTLEYRAEEVLGRSIFEIIDPAYHEHCMQILEQLNQQQKPQSIEVGFRTKSGRAIVVEGSISVWKHHGAKLLTNGIFRDITNRKQAEDALRHANSELELAIRIKNEFLSNMSHELRAPLNAILVLSESLLDHSRGPLNDGQSRALNSILESGQHLSNLINDILDLTKIEAGQLEMSYEPIAILDLCRSSIQSVLLFAEKKQIQTHIQCDPSIGICEADPKRFKQVLTNLLSNAIKFTPAGGQISLIVEQIGATSSDRICFRICDTGIGIASEDLSRLFQPFTQLDAGLSRQYEGTGLGLTLVQRLTELHHGSLEVHSALGHGSCFKVCIPRL